MTIQKIKEQLPTADRPIVKVLHENHCFMVALIGFANGMMLREKKLDNPSKLTVLNGSVKYFEVDKKVILQQYDEFEIPAEVTHYIVAEDNSLCLLTQDRLFQDN